MAEHLKLAVPVIIPTLTDLLNAILAACHVPESFKTGVIIPILKKGKNPLDTDIEGLPSHPYWVSS